MENGAALASTGGFAPAQAASTNQPHQRRGDKAQRMRPEPCVCGGIGLPPPGRAIKTHHEGVDGLRNILELNGPHRLKSQVKFLDVIAHDGRYADTAGRTDRLQPRRNVDAVMDVLLVGDRSPMLMPMRKRMRRSGGSPLSNSGYASVSRPQSAQPTRRWRTPSSANRRRCCGFSRHIAKRGSIRARRNRARRE